MGFLLFPSRWDLAALVLAALKGLPPIFGCLTCQTVRNTAQLLLPARLFCIPPLLFHRHAFTNRVSWSLGWGSPPVSFPSLQVLGTACSNCLHHSPVPSKTCFLLHLPFPVCLALTTVSCKVIHQSQEQKSSIPMLLSLKIKP